MKTTVPPHTRSLVDSIVTGIREKKGKNITLLNLSPIDDAICTYMVIAEGNTPTQVSAIEDAVREIVRKEQGETLSHIHVGSGEWIAIDYIDVIVHLFVPHAREYYKLERLWEDAERTDLPNED